MGGAAVSIRADPALTARCLPRRIRASAGPAARATTMMESSTTTRGRVGISVKKTERTKGKKPYAACARSGGEQRSSWHSDGVVVSTKGWHAATLPASRPTARGQTASGPLDPPRPLCTNTPEGGPTPLAPYTPSPPRGARPPSPPMHHHPRGGSHPPRPLCTITPEGGPTPLAPYAPSPPRGARPPSPPMLHLSPRPSIGARSDPPSPPWGVRPPPRLERPPWPTHDLARVPSNRAPGSGSKRAGPHAFHAHD
jgi:hypothetical protein